MTLELMPSCAETYHIFLKDYSLLDKSVVAAATAMYQEAISTLMSFLMKAGLSLNVFWQRSSKLLPHVVDLFDIQEALDCTLHLFGLTFFPEILCFLLQNNLS